MLRVMTGESLPESLWSIYSSKMSDPAEMPAKQTTSARVEAARAGVLLQKGE